jgi:hypothetical protein
MLKEEKKESCKDCDFYYQKKQFNKENNTIIKKDFCDNYLTLSESSKVGELKVLTPCPKFKIKNTNRSFLDKIFG